MSAFLSRRHEPICRMCACDRSPRGEAEGLAGRGRSGLQERQLCLIQLQLG